MLVLSVANKDMVAAAYFHISFQLQLRTWVYMAKLVLITEELETDLIH